MSAERAWDLPEQRGGFEHAYTDVERLFVMSRPLDAAVPGTLNTQRVVRAFKQHLLEIDDPTLPAAENVIPIPTAASAAGMHSILQYYTPCAHDAIAVVGGDGTKGNAHAGALMAGFNGLFLSIAGGNADDQTHMLFRARDIKKPVPAMLRSRKADLHLLEVTSSQPNPAGETTVYTTGYVSFGDLISGVAAGVSSPVFRSETAGMSAVKKFQTETKAMLGHIGTGRLVTIEDNAGTRTRSDLLLTNGQRMAKNIHFGGVCLLRPGFGHFELKRSSLPSVATGLGKASIGLFRHFDEDGSYTFRVSSEDEAPVHIQRDGEFDTYPSGTEFTVRLHQRPLHIATTRKQ